MSDALEGKKKRKCWVRTNRIKTRCFPASVRVDRDKLYGRIKTLLYVNINEYLVENLDNTFWNLSRSQRISSRHTNTTDSFDMLSSFSFLTFYDRNVRQ